MVDLIGKTLFNPSNAEAAFVQRDTKIIKGSQWLEVNSNTVVLRHRYDNAKMNNVFTLNLKSATVDLIEKKTLVNSYIMG